MSGMRGPDYTLNPVCPEVCFFMCATPDDIKIGEALYWQREAELLLFDVQVALLMEKGVDSIGTIKEAVEFRGKSLLPINKEEKLFKKILDDRKNLGQANDLLAERVSRCSLGTNIATAMANKCKNLMRIECINADQKREMIEKDADAFINMLIQKHILQFLSLDKGSQIFPSTINSLKNDFAILHEIVLAYAILCGSDGPEKLSKR